MPQVRIETRDHWLQGRNAQLFQAIQDGLVEGIKIPPDDQCFRLITYDAPHFPTPPGKTDPIPPELPQPGGPQPEDVPPAPSHPTGPPAPVA